MAKCKNCINLHNHYDDEHIFVGKWCEKIYDYPDVEIERDCIFYGAMTNADRIRAMTDEELAKFIQSVQCCSHYGADCGFPFCHSMKGDYCNGIKDNTDKELFEWLQAEVEE